MTAGFRLPRNDCLVHLLIVLVMSWFGSAAYLSYALEPREYAIEVSADVLASPFGLRLNWEPSSFARTYTISRRVFGTAEWGAPIASLPSGSSQFTDTSVAEGTAYEYEIQLETTERGAGGWVKAYGYVLAGGNVSWPDQKGKVLVIIDDVAAASLGNEVNLFLRDLIGAGWNPIRRDLARTTSVPEVKNIIRAEYNADPSNVRSVILVGHVPVPYSGNIAPDLHESHRGAWPADAFYADVDGTWTDSVVNINSGDYDANDNWVGDGKYDQSQIPSQVELEIGRIDFYDLPAFNGRTQTDLLRAYLQRNSQFRHRGFTAARRMLIRDNFGDLSGDAPAVDAWRHYRQFFGAGAVREVGPGDFFWTLQNESFLWAYGCGGGGNTKADGVGSITDFASQNPKAVFMVLHGSYFGDWNTKDNFLRAAVASAGYSLASIWSGLPHWFMHPMGLGRNIGFATRLTQNNASAYKSHLNFAAQQVHISLIGDPTLENYPVIPPRNLTGSAPGNVELSWLGSSDENVVGYHVYYSGAASGPFQRLTTAAVSSTSYSHPVGVGTHYYMVRAVKLERSGSGTFYNLSQGIFTTVNKSTGGVLPEINISVQDGNVSETGPNNGTLKVSRSFADGNPLRVDILPGGTAQEGVDYNSLGTSISIPASASEATLTVVPVADNLVEGGETMSVQIRPSASYTIGSASSAVLTIADGVNRPPTISQVPDQTIESGKSSVDLPFAIGDAETSASALQVRARSSNEGILPLSGIVLGGSGTNRTVRVSPASATNGTVTVTLIVSDQANEVSSVFMVTVLPSNKPPKAFPQAVQTLENVPLSVLLSGQDPEGKTISFAIEVPPGNGSINGSPPNIVYTPRSNFFGTDVFSFTVHDGQLESAPAEVSILIVEGNKPPLALPSQTNVLEDTVVGVHLSGTDPNGDLLQYEIVTSPTNGNLTKITNGLYTYVPSTNFHGADSFSFRATDGEFYSSPAIFNLTVVGTNDLPVAQGWSGTSREDEIIEIALTASDPDGDMLTFQLISPPANGILSGTFPDFTYRPHTDFFGSDLFAYVVTDGSATSAIATINLSVEPVDDTPVAEALVVETLEDIPVVITLGGSDAEESTLSFQLVSLPDDGLISGAPPNLLFHPKTNFSGTNTLQFVVHDRVLTSQVSAVTIFVRPENDPPVIGALPALSCRKNAVAGPVVLDLSDVDTGLSELWVWAESSNEILISTNRIAFIPGTTNRQMKLWPTGNLIGESEITVHVSDETASVATGFLFSVTNTPPQPQDDEILESVGTATIPLSQLLWNDVDLDEEPIAIASVSMSRLGRTVQLTDDTVIYFGSTNATQDSFTYEVVDTSGVKASATVVITMTEAPRIASVSLADGNVHLRVIGKANHEFRVLSSGDGRNWEHRGTGMSDASGRGEFLETGGANARHRFYRTEWP